MADHVSVCLNHFLNYTLEKTGWKVGDVRKLPNIDEIYLPSPTTTWIDVFQRAHYHSDHQEIDCALVANGQQIYLLLFNLSSLYIFQIEQQDIRCTMIH